MIRWRLGALARRLTDNYRRSSLQVVLAVSFTLITAAALLAIGVSMYLRFTGMIRQQIGEDNKRLLAQVNYNIDSYLRSMMQVSNTMYYTVIKNANLETDTLTDAMNMLYDTNQAQIVSIAVFDEDGGLVAGVPQSQMKPGLDAAAQDWFTAASARIENLHFGTPHVQNLFADPGGRRHWVISLSRAVELTYGGSTRQGVLLIDMDFSGVAQVCKNLSLGESGYLYVIDGDGDIVYHPNQQLLYAGLWHENNLAAADFEDGNFIERFDGKERMVTVKAVGYTGWKIIGVTPLSDVTASYRPSSLYAVILVLFAIVLMAFVNIFVSSRIAVPIKSLEKSVNAIERGDLNAAVYIGGSYEVQHLGQAVRSMVQQMRRLMDDVVREQEQKRVRELEVLQSQINPHFLYNTLDSIIWMIENEQFDGAIRMVTALARLFRISLSKGRAIITVASELEHARNYLTIQQMRYQNKFSTVIRCDPDAAKLPTVKLIVQPLLENAIYHGMEYKDGDGEIEVHAYLDGSALLIDVTDNGDGMPPETAARLLEDGAPTSGKGSGIGLRNVQERIRLTYGSGYGLTVFSEPDRGTTVRIRLPGAEGVDGA